MIVYGIMAEESIGRLFIAGDARHRRFRQLGIAVGEGLLAAMAAGTVSRDAAKTVFERLVEEGGTAAGWIESLGLSTAADDATPAPGATHPVRPLSAAVSPNSSPVMP